MDNLTHTIVGLVAGETMARVTRSPRRASLLLVGMVGGNLPDGDLLVSYGGGKLGYLLQHRGYTHTIVGCVALGLLLYLLTALVHRARGDPLARREQVAIAAFAVFAVLLHLGMDALNSYGVHPFWPFDDRWYYGDVLFIVEPSFWIAAAPLVLLQRTRAARIALGAVLLVALLLDVFLHQGQVVQWVVVTLVAAVLVVLGRKAPPAVAATVAAAASIAVALLFVFSGAIATRAVAASAAGRFTGEAAIDDVMTPAPMQPACWDALSLRRTAERYLARRAGVTLWPELLPPRCVRVAQPGVVTAPWTTIRSGREPDPRVSWLSVIDLPIASLVEHVRGDCRIEALMQFARAPYVGRHDGQWYAGDLRFDREAGLGFAELPVREPGGVCPRPVPWAMPRAELFPRP